MRSRLGELPYPASIGNVLCLYASMDDPWGQPSSPVPVQLTLRLMCNPSEERPLRFVCGVPPLPNGTNDPCGQSAPLCDGEDYPCGKPPPGEPPLTLRQGRTGTEERILHPVCGVTLLITPPPFILITLLSLLPPPSSTMVSTLVSAMLLVSVSRVRTLYSSTRVFYNALELRHRLARNF